MRIMKKPLVLFAALLCSILFLSALNAETYAAPVLKAQVERPKNAAFTTVKISWEIKRSKVSYVKLKYGVCLQNGDFAGKTKTLKFKKVSKARL